MSETEHLIGTLERAIARTARLLEADAALAAEQAEEILASIPNHPPAVFYLGIAKRRMGDVDAALDVFDRLVNAQHKWGAAWYERGVTLAQLGRGDEAIDSLYKAVDNQPDHPESVSLLIHPDPGDHQHRLLYWVHPVDLVRPSAGQSRTRPHRSCRDPAPGLLPWLGNHPLFLRCRR